MAESQQNDEGRPQPSGESGVFEDEIIVDTHNLFGPNSQWQSLSPNELNYNEFGDEIKNNDINYKLSEPTNSVHTPEGEKFFFTKKEVMLMIRDRTRLAKLQAAVNSGELIKASVQNNTQSNLNNNSQNLNRPGSSNSASANNMTNLPNNQNMSPNLGPSVNSNNTGPSVKPKIRFQTNPGVSTPNANATFNQTQSYAQIAGMHIPPNQNQMPNPNVNTFSNPSQSFSQAPFIITNQKPPPELPVFRKNTIDHFNKYLVFFENYCVQNYLNNRDQWASMLINKMSKEIKATLPNEAEFEWTYEEVVANIQDYIKLAGDKDDSSLTSKFWSLTKDPHDSVTVFGTKLLAAFKAAFPHEIPTYGTNKQLKEKYLACIDDDTQHWVNSSTMVHNSTGQTLFYETYVNLAEKFEKEVKPRQQRLARAPQAAVAPKYYAGQYKNVQQNKLTQGSEPQLNLESEDPSQLIQDLESFNFVVPPPIVQPQVQQRTYYPTMNYNYPYMQSTAPPATVPMQHLQAHQEVPKKDNPPVKNTPPGVCNYCERHGHLRAQCRLLKVRESEPHSTWCNKCLNRNHLDTYCTYKVNNKYSKFSSNYNKHFYKHSKFYQSNYAKSNKYYGNSQSYKSNINKTSVQNQGHTGYFKLQKEIHNRLIKLPSDLKSKVVKIYNLNDPKNNFIICPHSKVQNNTQCTQCQNSHPDILRLEKIIASFNSQYISKESQVKTYNISSHNNIKSSVQPSVQNNNNTNVKNKKVAKKHKKVKVNKNSVKQSKYFRDHTDKKDITDDWDIKDKSKRSDLDIIYSNNKVVTNNKRDNDRVKTLSMQPDLPNKPPSEKTKFHNKFHNSFTKELDKTHKQELKMLTVTSNGHTQFELVGSCEKFNPGAMNTVSSLTIPTHIFGIMNTPQRIKVINESFNTPTTVKNITPNLFWVNVNNSFIHSLVDTGSEYSSIRSDLIAKLNLQITPLPDNECDYSVGLAGHIPIEGTVVLKIKFLDIDLGEHLFKVIPKLSEDTDEIVLGIDFLIKKELIYCGDRRILRGYHPDYHIWTYQSTTNSVTRIWSEIDCKIKTGIKIKPYSKQVVSVNVDLQPHLVDRDTRYDVDTEINLIRTLTTDDMPYEHLGKYDLRYYTSFPENLYIVDLVDPQLEINNQSSHLLKYTDDALVGKAYNIRSIYMNVEDVDPNYANKYVLLKEKGIYDPPAHIECLLKLNLLNNQVYGNNLLNNAYNNTVLNSLTSDGIKNGTHLFNIESDCEIKINVDEATNNNCDDIPDDPLLSDFNLPDEFNLKDPDEWTKESLTESVKLGDCPLTIGDAVIDLLWAYKETVSNSTTVEPSSLPEVHFIPKSDEIAYTPQYKFGAGTSAEIEKIVQDLFQANIIGRTNSFFNNPIHLVRKKDGSGRICIDMRKVNNLLQTPVHSPLPSVEDVMSELHGMKVFSSLDLLSGFFQINLAPDSRKYTAFTTVHRYQYVRLPFGCSASPIEFTRLLNIALQDMLVPIKLSGDEKPRTHCKIYVDDLFLYSATYEDHLELLEMLFKLLSKNNLKLKLEKCTFVAKEVTFLGFRFTGTHVEKEQKYIDKVTALPKPNTIKDVMRLLGSCVYIHRFIEQYATIARPLTSLATTCKKKMRGTVEWNEEMEDAYKALKDHVAKQVKLAYPDYSAKASPLVIATDASTVGTGGVLQQVQNGINHIIAFTSSTFNKTQLNYTTTELEILAIKASIRAFHPFIAGRKFEIHSDHAPLLYLVSMRPFNGRIARTLEFLSNYDFTVKWVAGKDNTWPDMLSRTCNWDQTEKNKFNNNTIESYTYFPKNVTVVNRDAEREESLLYALVRGLCNLESPVREFRADEVDALRMKLYDELDKNYKEYNYIKSKDFPSYQLKGRPLTLIFIQACANLHDLDVIMYFGLDTPIVFKSKHGNKNHRNIIIQSIGDEYFNLLKIIDAKINTHIQMAVNSSFQPLTTIDQIIAERDDPAQDIVDPLVYLSLANNDLSPTYVDTKMQNIENIKQNPKKSSFYEIPKRKPIKAETVPILEHAKAYDQEMDGQFREVHPESYGNWYSRCCKHPYTTDCFVPLVCGDLRFCGNLDTGSTCSVLSLDVAEKLFKANKLKKLYDTQINLVCAGGLSRTVNTRIVTADVSIGTARLCGEAEYIPPISLEYFLSEIDLLALQQELAHYNKIKNNLLIEDDIVYYKKEPYDQVPLLPTNCIITMALRIHDKYSHCGRDKLVDWLRLWASPDKTLLKNPDFFEYYNYYRPMTPIELHRYSEECDPVEERTFSRNWRPSDEPCEIDAEDLSDEFNDDQEVQNPDHESNSDHESESESDEEGTSGGYKMPDPTQIIFLPPPQTYSQMPKIPSLGEPSNTHTPWSHRNMSSPYVNNYNNGDSAPPNLNNNDRLIHPPPSFTPSMDQHQFSPIQPIPHVYTPTPSFKTPQRDVYTPETNNTPPCVPKPIFTPQKSPTPIQRVPTPSKAPPIVDKNYNYTHNLEELDKSPKLHSPSPQQYFNNNYDYNQNNQDNNRDCNTPPYPNNYYQTLLNEGSPFKSTSSPYSHHQPGQQTTRGPSPDQVNEQEPKLISSGENEVSVPTTNPIPEDNTTSYRVPSPSRMVTRSQTRKENEK
ncbi:unnamed protein product [Rotaria magnacalcarata]|uniref:RNA-directed DNA polymerase n=1 Tax=Rotaria magnacalcarata TaxID=392030 RepID=A0A819RFF6_9BILA|nr:unnamed protein product [Rotaria magnacalcarata]